jgi:hypothetical protein
MNSTGAVLEAVPWLNEGSLDVDGSLVQGHRSRRSLFP